MPIDSHVILSQTAHRPDPLPKRPWLGRQSWYNLLLAHWQTSPEAIQALLPPSLSVDTFANKAWVGTVAYRMVHVRLRGMPAWSAMTFPQLNLRTYVIHRGRPGIFFFSLDASNSLAVTTGRFITGLPYFRASMKWEDKNGEFYFDSARKNDGRGFCANYQALPYSLSDSVKQRDRFLTERYVFYAQQADGRLTAGDVCHGPWVLQPAKATIHANSLKDRFSVPLADSPDCLHYAPGVDVLFWKPVVAEKKKSSPARLTMLR